MSAEHAARRAVPAADNLRHAAVISGAWGDRSVVQPMWDAADMLNDLSNKVEAIDALHQPYQIWDNWNECWTDPYCSHDELAWPCPTHLILHPTEEGL